MSRSSNRRPVTAALAAIALLTTGLAGTSAAQAAGDLHVSVGGASKVGPWSGLTIGSPTSTGSFGINMPSGAAQGFANSASLNAPSGTSITSAAANYSYDAPVSGDHSQPQINTSWGNFGYPAQASGGGGYSSQAGSGNATASGNLSMQINCVNFDGVSGSCGAGASFTINSLDLVLNDANGPTVTGTMTGGLIDGTWQTGSSASVDVTAADQGAGVFRAWIKDGSQTYYALANPDSSTCKDINPSDSNPYEFATNGLTLAPCATTSTQYDPTFDLTGMGDGVHSVSVGIEDAGGNQKTIFTNHVIRVNAPGGLLPDEGTSGPGGCVYGADGSTCTPTTPSGGGGGGGNGGGGGGGAGGSGGTTNVGGGSTNPGTSSTTDTTSAPSANPGGTTETPPFYVPPITPEVINGANASDAAKVSSTVHGKSRRGVVTITVPYGRKVHLSGKVIAPNGKPVVGAAVQVISAASGIGAHSAAATTVRTNTKGVYVYSAPVGGSRTITFGYKYKGSDTKYVGTSTIVLAVKARIALKPVRGTKHNGHTVTFRGTVAGAPKGSRKTVDLLAWNGRVWVTVRSAKLHNGTFTAKYRFTHTVGVNHFKFRARVQPAANWPFEAGVSKTQLVKVVG